MNDPRLKKAKILTSKEETVNIALMEAFKRTSLELLASQKPQLDSRFSGSTAVTVLIKDGTLYCANLGDSRAVLASYKKIENS
jgi:protein phosphatase 2C family protein 2/3